ITALRQELPDALHSLQQGNIAPVDLAQAAIGPGMAVFTRYAKVMETDGSPMTVRTALGLINVSVRPTPFLTAVVQWPPKGGQTHGPRPTARSAQRTVLAVLD
ncbi:MAG: hypothetical protein JOZ58_00590, partial [Acetobacteraceae bacterium]|nr:hypothetical protein [Acetobacteraceae bacterium]